MRDGSLRTKRKSSERVASLVEWGVVTDGMKSFVIHRYAHDKYEKSSDTEGSEQIGKGR